MMNGADTAGEHYLNSLSAGQLERKHFTSKELPIDCFNDGLNCRHAGGVRVDVGVLTRGGPCQRYGGNTAFSVVAAAYSVDTDSARASCEKVAWSVLDVCREVAKNDSCRRGLMMSCTFNEKYDRE